MKASVHRRLEQLEEIRAQELEVLRCREHQEESRRASEELGARIDALIQKHGIPEEPPENLAEIVQDMRRQLMEREAGRL